MNSYIKKHLLNSKNIILSILVFLIGLIIMLSISIAVTMNIYKSDVEKYDLNARKIIVQSENEDDNDELFEYLDDIEHVKSVDGIIYSKDFDTYVSEFDNENLEGYVHIATILDEDIIDITNGHLPTSDDEAICSDSFYPYEYSSKINTSNILKYKDIKDKTFTVESENEDDVTLTFKVVGTYDSTTNVDAINTCYITKSSFEKLASRYVGSVKHVNTKTGETTYEIFKLQGRVVIVDDASNVDKVYSEISKLGLIAMKGYEIDEGYMQLVTYTPTFFSITVALIFLAIINSVLIKKLKYNSKYYAILKSIGYDNKTIKNLDLCGNLVIANVSLIISSIVYIIIFYIVRNVVYEEAIYEGLTIRFSLIPVLLTITILDLIIIYVNKRILSKLLNKNISEILS